MISSLLCFGGLALYGSGPRPLPHQPVQFRCWQGTSRCLFICGGFRRIWDWITLVGGWFYQVAVHGCFRWVLRSLEEGGQGGPAYWCSCFQHNLVDYIWRIMSCRWKLGPPWNKVLGKFSAKLGVRFPMLLHTYEVPRDLWAEFAVALCSVLQLQLSLPVQVGLSGCCTLPSRALFPDHCKSASEVGELATFPLCFCPSNSLVNLKGLVIIGRTCPGPLVMPLGPAEDPDLVCRMHISCAKPVLSCTSLNRSVVMPTENGSESPETSFKWETLLSVWPSRLPPMSAPVEQFVLGGGCPPKPLKAKMIKTQTNWKRCNLKCSYVVK